ncbi:hypothetical protein FZW96_14500 [Bacillus sp. BGMRC 2118]|nr:hypothetical protein FZW96_14500 [Bacillus sp. BGMRC 2118]
MKFTRKIIVFVMIGIILIVGYRSVHNWNDRRDLDVEDLLHYKRSDFNSLTFRNAGETGWLTEDREAADKLVDFLDQYHVKESNYETFRHHISEDGFQFTISYKKKDPISVSVLESKILILTDDYYEILNSPVDMEWIGQFREKYSDEKPPPVTVKVGNKKYKTTLGTYCWKLICADAVGYQELLKDEDPIVVKPGEKLSFNMEYKLKPDKISVIERHSNEDREVPIKNDRIVAPSEKGIYYYFYSADWSNSGDAGYVFFIEVE